MGSGTLCPLLSDGMPYRVLCPNDQNETDRSLNLRCVDTSLVFGNKCPNAWLCLFAVALPILATGVSGHEIRKDDDGSAWCSSKSKKVLGGGCKCKPGSVVYESNPTTSASFDGWSCKCCTVCDKDKCVFSCDNKVYETYAICATAAQ